MDVGALTVVAPKHAVGMVDVRVTGGYGESTATARDRYTFEVPGAPLMTSVTPRDGSLVVGWVPPASDGGNPVEGYTLTATGGATTVTVKAAASAASATLTGLANGTFYSLSLTAANAVGDSSAASGSGTPQAAHAPSAPAGLSVVPDGNGGLVASWSPPSGSFGALHHGPSDSIM